MGDRFLVQLSFSRADAITVGNLQTGAMVYGVNPLLPVGGCDPGTAKNHASNAIIE